MWSTELDSDFFRIFDKDRKIAGYFWPDYGQILPEDKYDEIVQLMHKNHDSIPGGFLTIPMIKFGIFGFLLQKEKKRIEKEKIIKGTIFQNY